MRVRALVLVPLAVGATSCVSFKAVPDLDDAEQAEFASLAPRLRAERFCVKATNERAREDAAEVEAALRTAGAHVVADEPTISVEVQQPWRSLDEPMLCLLTLGFFPHFGPGNHRSHWRLVAEDGRQVAGEASVRSPHWIGWLVAPIALLPGWKLHTPVTPDVQETESHSHARRAHLALGIARSVARLRVTR